MLAKLENGILKPARGKVLKYDNIIVANPREEDFAKAGYKEVVDGERLPDKEGFYQVPVYTENENTIKISYEYQEAADESEI